MPKYSNPSWAYDNFMRQAHILTPAFLSAPALIGVLIYELVEKKSLSTSEKDNLAYAELGLSFLASLLVYIFIWGLISIKFSFTLILIILFVILISPFGLAVLKVSLKDTLDETSTDALSGLIILSTIFFTRLSLALSIAL
jgi:multisubunit Na+/H+ antiporter MnhG subunit